MVKIVSRLERYDASDAIRRRGEEYFREGRVAITSGGTKSVTATVRGGRPYDVRIQAGGEDLVVSCTCRYCVDHGECCKHVWATLLAAESREGFLTALNRRGDIYLRLPEDFEDADPFDRFSDGPEDVAIPSPLATEARLLDGDGRSPPEARSADDWRLRLRRLDKAGSKAPAATTAAGEDYLYVLDCDETVRLGLITIDVWRRGRRKSGDWGEAKPFNISLASRAPTDALQQQIWMLLALSDTDAGASVWYGYRTGSRTHQDNRITCPTELGDTLFPMLCRAGGFHAERSNQTSARRELSLDEGPPWDLRLRVAALESAWSIGAVLTRGEDVVPLAEPLILLATGWFVHGHRLARFEPHGAFAWVVEERARGPLVVPRAQEAQLLADLWHTPALPPVDWPEELRLEEVRTTPGPHLAVRQPSPDDPRKHPRLCASLSFRYGDALVPRDPEPRPVPLAATRRLIVRDVEAEATATRTLLRLGARMPADYLVYRGVIGEHELELSPRDLPHVVRELTKRGWHVEAEGTVYRQPGSLRLSVSSGIDWFDLEGSVDFGDETFRLPALLAAIRRGESSVVLSDGSHGMLPGEWLEKYGSLLRAGKIEEDSVRFRANQVALLDALLASQETATWDETFARASAELRSFDRIEPAEAPDSFRGELRPYQRQGLGWLRFLRRFGLGGCLADDMGLGKTVQVLALLAGRYGSGENDRPRPSLIVVPRSLVFNWLLEARRFTPELRVLDHTGPGRVKDLDHLRQFDVVITTYGTLRRDIVHLKDVRFDLVVLDESQAIKNAGSIAAKAARLLEADHRLALSGTPIENHLGELWSLMEFLNPGMLGSSSAFASARGRQGRSPRNGPNGENGGDTRNGDNGKNASHLRPLARALRPLILRRTKKEVAKDLPEKVEQTIICDLPPQHRKVYSEVRDHFRASLLGQIDAAGMERSKIHVLEALLRLRQVACHPGLVDRARRGEPSAKLSLLHERLEEIRADGHKALVFSQFTSLLAIVRERLESDGVAFEYLDGRTRRRDEKVRRFQEDPDCPIFLVSLKAGGCGLNLTAADYVFLLDPWWNPAVEAQAIDRTHRIGQTKKVFAYRIIARDTVEEKVLELQQRKRELVEELLGGQGGLLRDLTREDLEHLLS